MIRVVYLFCLLLCYIVSPAQNFGGFRPSTKWKQINTDTARIIFESASTAEAERISTIIHKMAAEQPASLGDGLKKINIVLHQNTTLANGYVGLGPYRSEYYLIPSSNVFELGNLPWYEHLAVHEYRHVQQYNNFNRGLSKAFSVVFGQEGRALANSLAVPNWFFEGDAVHAETSLTPQGRGRLPYFLSGYKSLWQANRKYSLMKLLNGSLKDYVPNHYQFGYLAVNYGYQQYGRDFWKKVTNDAAAFKGLIYPFRKAIRRYANTSYKNFTAEALQQNSQKINIKENSSNKHGTVTNIYFPQFMNEDSLIYVKESYRKLPAFYVRNGKGEQRIQLRNISAEDWMNYRKGMLVYTSFYTNPRWSLTDFSDVILMNVYSGKQKRLTHKGKYFTPVIAPSGKNVVAVSINDSAQTELHVLDIQTGQLVKKIESNNRFFVHPAFVDDETIVIAIRSRNGAMSLNLLNLSTENIETLTPAGFSVLGYPSVANDTVYFTASFSGNDELYSLSLNDRQLRQLTQSQTGNYYAQATGKKMIWSAFTDKGLQLQEVTRDYLLNNVTDIEKNKLYPYPIANASANILATPTRNFSMKTYHKATGLFNFHSWRPSYSDPELLFSLFGNNVLNTLQTEVFYRFNQNEQSHGVGARLSYSALFPVLNLGYEYTFNRNVRIRTLQNTIIPGTLNAYELRAGYSIPLDFTGGKTYKLLSFGNNYVYNQQLPTGRTKNILQSFSTSYLHHFINWTQQLPRAVQQIYPKLGYSVAGAYRHRLGESGYQFITNGQLYLPSVANHSIVLAGSFQQEDASNILFSNRFSNARGYPESDSSRMWRASLNYHFPLFYPDWGFGGIVYFLRLRSNVFYDYSRLFHKNKLSSIPLRSTGAELFFDTKWWNQLPVSFGIRYSYLLDARLAGISKHQWEIVIPTDLFSR